MISYYDYVYLHDYVYDIYVHIDYDVCVYDYVCQWLSMTMSVNDCLWLCIWLIEYVYDYVYD